MGNSSPNAGRHPAVVLSGQHAVHHQGVERCLVVDGLHPLFSAIDPVSRLLRAPRPLFGAIKQDLGTMGGSTLGVALMAERLQLRRCEREEDEMRRWRNGECALEPRWIYNGSTPTLCLLGFLGNRARHAAFTHEISARHPGLLTGPSGSTSQAASYTSRQMELSAKALFRRYYSTSFKQDYFLF